MGSQLINLLFIFILMLAIPAKGEGPQYKQADRIAQIEFDNVYQDLRNLRNSVPFLVTASATTSTVTTINSNTNTDTNVSVSITPKGSSPKVLVTISAPWRITGTDLANGCQVRLKKNGSVLLTIANLLPQVSGQAEDALLAYSYLDTSATTGVANTYTINLISNNASNTITMPISASFTASIVATEVQ